MPYLKRRVINAVQLTIASSVTLLACASLGWILFSLFQQGLPGLHFSVFFNTTHSPGSGGGLGNAILGSLLLTGCAIVLATPIGILGGCWLAEFGADSRLARAVRMINDVMLSAPSIIVGLFVYAVCVVPLGHFSGWAGVIALTIIVLPVITRTTEDMLELVPTALREASVALGAPRWKTCLMIALRVARTGVLTGILLGLARISGETAPLMFTALNNPFWSVNMNQPVANLPMVIYQYVMSPYNDWHQLAWTGALLITMWMLGINLWVRVVFQQKSPLHSLRKK